MKLSIIPVLAVAMQITAFAQTNSKCADMTKFKSPGVTLEITRAEAMPAGRAPGARGGRGGPAGPELPAHCRIDGMMDQRTGTDGKTYGIRFAIALPDNWTGQYLQQGGGGLNGTVGEPTGAQAAGDRPALVRGFAVATTDTGHQSAGGGVRWQLHAGSAGRSRLRIRRERARRRARETNHRELLRQAGSAFLLRRLLHRRTRSDAHVSALSALLRRHRCRRSRDAHGTFESRDAHRDGEPESRLRRKARTASLLPGGGLTDGDRKAIIAKLLDVCDARDGMKDGMIFDVTGCTFKPADLQCPAAKMEGCLSKEQVDAITIAFAGPKDSRGNQVYPGFFFDTGITATGGGIPGLLATGNSPIGPPTTAVQQDIDAEAARVNSNPTSLIGDSWTWTNLNTFSSHGGKLIFYHGVSDPWFSAKDTIDYYQRMSMANGGDAKVKDWSRLFLSPGMGHCSGGSAALDTFDMLSAAVNWVEKNTPPDSITATGRAFPGRSRPLCPYPAHAQYNGAGDPENASSYSCRP